MKDKQQPSEHINDAVLYLTFNRLTDNDKQRIEKLFRETQLGEYARKRVVKAMLAYAEYATRYEREQQETLKNQVEYWRNCKVCSDDIDEAVIKKLEAERSDLIGKLQARLERCRKVSGYSSGFSDIHNEIDFLDLLLNSLKTK